MAGARPETGSAQLKLETAVTLGALVLAVVYSAVVIAIASPTTFYTLDDPYIHMALAENLARGHFGVNLGELSNPSSSILWPWLLASFEKLGVMLWAPLLLNIACFIATLRVVLAFCLPRLAPDGQVAATLVLLGVALFAINLFGVIYTGMEHSLHVLLTAIVITRAIDGRHDRIALVAMVLSPLVRFEGVLLLAFGVGAALYDRKWLVACAAVALSLGLVGAYALWLTSLGLPALPSSVLSKSALSSGVVDGGGGIGRLFANFGFNIAAPAAVPFILLAAAMIFSAVMSGGRNRVLALGMLAVLTLAFLAGKLDGYGRYEVYALLAGLLASVHLLADQIRAGLAKPLRVAVGCLIVLAACLNLGPYVTATTPLAARNIDRQQHQMHRVVTECWKQPVAINDLGWVSLRNDAYVLDLWGLGNEAARKARMSGEQGWMQRLAAEKGVALAMIYPGWYADIPAEWSPVAELGYDGPSITPAYRSVQVYATQPQAAPAIRACLEKISLSLPEGAWIKLGD